MEEGLPLGRERGGWQLPLPPRKHQEGWRCHRPSCGETALHTASTPGGCCGGNRPGGQPDGGWATAEERPGLVSRGGMKGALLLPRPLSGCPACLLYPCPAWAIGGTGQPAHPQATFHPLPSAAAGLARQALCPALHRPGATSPLQIFACPPHWLSSWGHRVRHSHAEVLVLGRGEAEPPCRESPLAGRRHKARARRDLGAPGGLSIGTGGHPQESPRGGARSGRGPQRQGPPEGAAPAEARLAPSPPASDQEGQQAKEQGSPQRGQAWQRSLSASPPRKAG